MRKYPEFDGAGSNNFRKGAQRFVLEMAQGPGFSATGRKTESL